MRFEISEGGFGTVVWRCVFGVMANLDLLVGGEVFEGCFACYFLEVLFEGVSSVAGFVELAGLVVEASVAGDVGVLEVFGPAADLARAAFGEVF